MINHFALLNIPPGTGQSGVEDAFEMFRLRISRYAPGIHLTNEEIALRFPDVWLAYKTLLDPESREAHEKEIVPPADAAQVAAEQPVGVNEGLLSRIRSGIFQAGVIIMMLLFIYALVHFAAL